MRVLLAAIVAVLCAGMVAPAAEASRSVRYGVHDDAWLRHGPGTLEQRLDELDALGVELVRYTLRWDEIESVYPTDFTLRTVPDRVEQEGDAWAGILDAKQDLGAVLAAGKMA